MLNENYVFKDIWLDGVANILNSISVGWGGGRRALVLILKIFLEKQNF